MLFYGKSLVKTALDAISGRSPGSNTTKNKYIYNWQILIKEYIYIYSQKIYYNNMCPETKLGGLLEDPERLERYQNLFAKAFPGQTALDVSVSYTHLTLPT